MPSLLDLMKPTNTMGPTTASAATTPYAEDWRKKTTISPNGWLGNFWDMAGITGQGFQSEQRLGPEQEGGAQWSTVSPQQLHYESLLGSMGDSLNKDPNYVLSPQEYMVHSTNPYTAQTDLAAYTKQLRELNAKAKADSEFMGTWGWMLPMGAALGAAAFAPGGFLAGGAGAGLGEAAWGANAIGAGEGAAAMGIPELGLVANPATANAAIAGGIPASMLSGGPGAITLGSLEGGLNLTNMPTGGGLGGGGGGGGLPNDPPAIQSGNLPAQTPGSTPVPSGGWTPNPSTTYWDNFSGAGSWIPGIPNNVALSLGGNLISSLLGLGGSYLSSQAQQNAANQAQNTIWNMYQQNRADLAPWRQAGVGALGTLTNLTTPGKQLDTAMLDPGYNFGLSEGLKAGDARLRAMGMANSGAAVKAATRYGNDYATQGFNNVYNRLANLAGLGQVGTTAGIAAGTNAANNVADLHTQAGNARASGYMGGANALSGGIGGAVNLFNQLALLDALKGTG